VVQELLARIHGDGRVYERWQSGESLLLTERLRLDAYDPRHVHVKADSWAEKDEAAFRESKPLRWLWTGFDASPLAHDVAVALPFRQTVANHLFADAGDDLQLFHGIRVPYGHNIEMGDRTVVHGNVLLDDRGELDIGAASPSPTTPSPTATATTSSTSRTCPFTERSSRTTRGSPPGR
jgi:maltose O-acetyltransferase